MTRLEQEWNLGWVEGADDNLRKAAPKLLDALKEAVRMYGQEGGPWNVPSHPGSWISQARAAIKEAEGEL